jgi:hypothetical protein
VINTSRMMGGALGLASITSLATARSNNLTAAGTTQLAALTGGYHAAFLAGAPFAIAAVVISAVLIRTLRQGTVPTPQRWRAVLPMGGVARGLGFALYCGHRPKGELKCLRYDGVRPGLQDWCGADR